MHHIFHVCFLFTLVVDSRNQRFHWSSYQIFFFRKRSQCKRRIQLKKEAYVGLDLQLKDNPTYEDVDTLHKYYPTVKLIVWRHINETRSHVIR